MGRNRKPGASKKLFSNSRKTVSSIAHLTLVHLPTGDLPLTRIHSMITGCEALASLKFGPGNQDPYWWVGRRLLRIMDDGVDETGKKKWSYGKVEMEYDPKTNEMTTIVTAIGEFYEPTPPGSPTIAAQESEVEISPRVYPFPAAAEGT